MAAALIGVYVGRRPRKDLPQRSYSRDAENLPRKYDVFFSSPLAGLSSDEEIKQYHDEIAPIVDCLENELDYRVFWAGKRIRSKADFEEPGFSAIDDVDALKESKYFVMYYPRRVASSVLFEAGIALRTCLFSIYFVNDKSDLPFLMASTSDVFTNVRIHKPATPSECLKILRKHGKKLFRINALTSRQSQ